MGIVCKLFSGSSMHFWRLARVFYCVSILVGTLVLSIVIIFQLLIITNQTQTYFEDFQSMAARLHYDNSRQYVIQDSVFVGSEWPSLTIDGEFDDTTSVVCLATQASIEKFHHIIESGTHWNGLMSVAIFTPGIENHIGSIYLQYLTRCFQDVMQNVSIDWVFPMDHPPEETSNLSSVSVDSLDCSKPKEVLEQLLNKRPSSMMSWRDPLHYPQNLMRNVARKSCISDYVLLTDVDIVPSPRMSQALSKFINTTRAKTCDCCVFVIPTYEIEKNSTLPKNKVELLDMVADKTARSYRVVAFKPNQASTNVSAWEALPHRESNVASVGYQIPTFKFGYEPFYLARDDVPPHDERFVGYGFTRNTQVYEMQKAGYDFFVLDHVFLIHPGMGLRYKYNSAKRKKETNGSYKISRKFLNELKVKYGEKSSNPRKSCNSGQSKKSIKYKK